MKRIGLLLLVLAVGVFVTGCQKQPPKKRLPPPRPPVSDTAPPKADKAAEEAKADKKAAEDP